MPHPHPADVTVIVTSYNHQAYVEQCLDSVLAQTRTPDRVIVFDDSSPDESVAVIEHWLDARGADYRFVPHAQNIGLNRSMNEALAMVETSHFLHISADDWLEPTRVERQLAAVDTEAPETAFLVGDFREVGPGGTTLAVHDIGARLAGLTGEAGREALFLSLLKANSIPAPAVLIRTEAARSVGGYDESLSFEDYDMWLKLVSEYPVAYQPGIVSHYRLLGSSMTRSADRIRAFRQTEAATLRKQIGHSAAADQIIEQRLAEIAAQVEAEVTLAREAAQAAPPATPRRRARLLRRRATDRSAG